MKKLLLSLVWIVATFALSAQTYREYETTHGKNYLIKDKNGKYTSVQCATPKGNATPENGFSSPVYRKEEVKPSSTINNSEDRTTYQLKLNFDVNMNSVNNYLFITSDSAIFQRDDLTWSEDGLTGKIDLPENTYEIIAMNNIDPSSGGDPEYVFIHDFTIVSDTSTEINFATMANHKIFLQCKDKNGVVIDPTSPTVLFNNVTIHIGLPENYLMSGSTNQIRVPNGYIMTSDIDLEYKIWLNQLFIRYGELYIADMGQIEGLTSDTVLQSNYSNYKKMDMVFHESPLSQTDSHLAFDYGILGYDNSGYYAILGCSGWGFNGNYPSFDKDTLHVFMDNREVEVSDGKMTVVARAHFYEGSDYMITEPFWVNSNDSIAFTKYNVSAASPQFQNGSIVDLGSTAPFYFFCFYNDRMGENEIDYDHYRGPSVGQINEMRQMDNHFSIYEIKKGSEVLVSDTLSDFTEPFYIAEQGIYTFSITNNNYAIKDQPGQSTFEASFDMGNEDANPPVISSFKLLDSENSITNSFESDKSGSILLSAYDYNYSTHMLNRPTSVQVFYKKFEDTDWTELNVVEHPNLYDPVDFGSFYKCNLNSLFAQFITSGYLDLKIVSADNVGNTVTQILHPAAYVENNVGIPQIVNNERKTMQVYPNPVSDNSIISFNIIQNTTTKLSVYNINGQLTDVLLDKTMEKGNHQINWNTTEKLTSGVYLLKLETGNTVETTKVIIK